MASISDLPTELLEYILVHLDSRDAVNLAQPCKALHAVALPAAYHTITLAWNNTPTDDTSSDTDTARKGPKVQPLIRTLTKNPEYMKLIKNLEFCAGGCLEFNFEDVCGSCFPDIEFDAKDEEWGNEIFNVGCGDGALSVRTKPATS